MKNSKTAPVVFFTYANQADNYLPNLEEEQRSIRKKLARLHDFDFIEYFDLGNTTIDDIFDHIPRFRERLAIFHYSGHAGGKHLELADRLADAGGMAQLLGQYPHLKLVFLNGCSTLGHVDALLRNGVPAVIATSVSINDARATAFAKQFYHSLSHRATLKEAFNEAAAKLQTQGAVPAGFIRLRGMTPENTAQELPWGLYAADDTALDWKFSFTEETIASSKALQTIRQQESAFDAMVRTDQHLDQQPDDLLQLELDGIKSNLQLLNHVLVSLRDALTLTDDPIARLRYESQIEAREQMTRDLKDRMENLVHQLRA